MTFVYKMNIIEKLDPDIQRTRKHFDFLFSKGYKIKCYSFMKYWAVVLEGPICLICLREDRGEFLLSFGPKNSLQFIKKQFYLQDQIFIQSMIYYVSGKEKVIGMFTNDFYKDSDDQLFFLSHLVKKYHDQIIPYFGSYEFIQNKEKLYQVSREYGELVREKYIIQKQPREVFDREKILEII